MTGYLSIGSNMGDRLNYLKSVVSELELRGVVSLKVSSIYESTPVETVEPQDNYLNLAAMVTFDMGPFALLNACFDTEARLDRTRPYFHAPRTVDIDILMIENIFIKTDALELPHPCMEKRAFVIWPLYEIAPALTLPSGRKIGEVRNSLKDSGNSNIWKI